ncbi:hypothetical protein CWI38_0687p0030, partial [Hamiltosporidium tvaerminnensis]
MQFTSLLFFFSLDKCSRRLIVDRKKVEHVLNDFVSMIHIERKCLNLSPRNTNSHKVCIANKYISDLDEINDSKKISKEFYEATNLTFDEKFSKDSKISSKEYFCNFQSLIENDCLDIKSFMTNRPQIFKVFGGTNPNTLEWPHIAHTEQLKSFKRPPPPKKKHLKQQPSAQQTAGQETAEQPIAEQLSQGKPPIPPKPEHLKKKPSAQQTAGQETAERPIAEKLSQGKPPIPPKPKFEKKTLATPGEPINTPITTPGQPITTPDQPITTLDQPITTP